MYGLFQKCLEITLNKMFI